MLREVSGSPPVDSSHDFAVRRRRAEGEIKKHDWFSPEADRETGELMLQLRDIADQAKKQGQRKEGLVFWEQHDGKNKLVGVLIELLRKTGVIQRAAHEFLWDNKGFLEHRNCVIIEDDVASAAEKILTAKATYSSFKADTGSPIEFLMKIVFPRQLDRELLHPLRAQKRGGHLAADMVHRTKQAYLEEEKARARGEDVPEDAKVVSAQEYEAPTDQRGRRDLEDREVTVETLHDRIAYREIIDQIFRVADPVDSLIFILRHGLGSDNFRRWQKIHTSELEAWLKTDGGEPTAKSAVVNRNRTLAEWARDLLPLAKNERLLLISPDDTNDLGMIGEAIGGVTYETVRKREGKLMKRLQEIVAKDEKRAA